MPATTSLPKYIQVSERLIRDVAAGHLANGSRLPPERDMARDLGLAVGTLRKALAVLEDKGLLERIQGSGNYIRRRGGVNSVYGFFRLEKPDGGGLPTAQVLAVDLCDKPQGAPRFGPGAQAWRIRRLRFLDGTAIAVEEIWLDGDQCAGMSCADLSESLYEFYRDHLGLVISAVEDRIGMGAVPDWAPPSFGPGAGTLAAHISRLSRSSTGHPVEFSRTWFDYKTARYVSRLEKG